MRFIVLSGARGFSLGTFPELTSYGAMSTGLNATTTLQFAILQALLPL